MVLGHRVILIVDAGVDDAHALLLYFQAHIRNQLKIEAIVCAMGTTTIEHVCRNVQRLMKMFRTTDIPLYKGAWSTLVRQHPPARRINGNDGFGDLNYQDFNPVLGPSLLNEQRGVFAIHDMIMKEKELLTLVSMAPLTTIALMIRLFNDDFLYHLRDFYIVGGNLEVPGKLEEDSQKTPEFNFGIDPEAAEIVLSNPGLKNVYLLTREACLGCTITFGWRYEELGKIVDSEFMKLMNRADRNVYAGKIESEIWCPYDVILATTLIRPHAHKEPTKHAASVELHDLPERGRMQLDKYTDRASQVYLIKEINYEVVKEYLMEANVDMHDLLSKNLL